MHFAVFIFVERWGRVHLLHNQHIGAICSNSNAAIEGSIDHFTKAELGRLFNSFLAF